MKIRDIEFKDIAFLAPMAGVTDMAFRELCTLFGAAYTVTEMVSKQGAGGHISSRCVLRPLFCFS